MLSLQVFDDKREDVVYDKGRVSYRYKQFTDNFKQELEKNVQEQLRYEYPKKEKQFQNGQLTLLSSAFSHKKGTPVIPFVEAQKAIFGCKQRLKVNNNPAAKSPGWSKNWQRKKTVAPDAKNKYAHDNSRQLAIKCTSKEDEGKYEAFLAQESNGNIYKILNNGFYRPQRSTMFYRKIYK